MTAPIRPRILMLPGWTQSATIYQGRLAAIQKSIGDKAELVFVDPVSCKPYLVP